jgi:ABC-2 type transport system ATP-binding protein
VVEIEVYGIDEGAVESLRRIAGVTSVAVENQEQAQVVVVQADSGREPTQEILARLDGVSVGRVTTREPTLEDAYVALVTEPAESVEHAPAPA